MCVLNSTFFFLSLFDSTWLTTQGIKLIFCHGLRGSGLGCGAGQSARHDEVLIFPAYGSTKFPRKKNNFSTHRVWFGGACRNRGMRFLPSVAGDGRRFLDWSQGDDSLVSECVVCALADGRSCTWQALQILCHCCVWAVAGNTERFGFLASVAGKGEFFLTGQVFTADIYHAPLADGCDVVCWSFFGSHHLQYPLTACRTCPSHLLVSGHEYNKLF
jgi:hypothetical protein